MKKLFGVFVILFVFSLPALAADSSMTWTASGDGTILLLTGTCTAASDGTFTAADIESTSVGFVYWNAGYRIIDAYAKTSATDDHTNAAAVTITDATGRQLIGTTVGDTLSLSQSASTFTYLSIDRASGQRAVTSKLNVAIADTGSTATVQTLYLVLGK